MAAVVAEAVHAKGAAEALEAAVQAGAGKRPGKLVFFLCTHMQGREKSHTNTVGRAG